MTKPTPLPPVAAVRRPQLSRMEQVYLAVLVHWYKHRAQAPRVEDLAEICRRERNPLLPTGKKKPRGWPSVTAVRSALLSLEDKGYTRRNDEGRFEVIR